MNEDVLKKEEKAPIRGATLTPITSDMIHQVFSFLSRLAIIEAPPAMPIFQFASV